MLILSPSPGHAFSFPGAGYMRVIQKVKAIFKLQGNRVREELVHCAVLTVPVEVFSHLQNSALPSVDWQQGGRKHGRSFARLHHRRTTWRSAVLWAEGMIATHHVAKHNTPITTVNFHRFHSFCPKKPHYATLSFDGAILQRSVHVFAPVAANRLKAERCSAND